RSIVSLVIAPHIKAGGTHGVGAGDCCASKNEQKMGCAAHHVHGKHHKMMAMGCDMEKCASMSKEECAQMCDSMGCDSAMKAACLSRYDENGKFMGPCMKSCEKKCTNHDECMKNCGEKCASMHFQSGAACCKGDKASCDKDPAHCEKKKAGGACCKDKQ